MTKEVKSCFHWREHPSETAHFFRRDTSQRSGGFRSAQNPIILPGSSKDDNAKKMMRRVKHG